LKLSRSRSISTSESSSCFTRGSPRIWGASATRGKSQEWRVLGAVEQARKLRHVFSERIALRAEAPAQRVAARSGVCGLGGGGGGDELVQLVAREDDRGVRGDNLAFRLGECCDGGSVSGRAAAVGRIVFAVRLACCGTTTSATRIVANVMILTVPMKTGR